MRKIKHFAGYGTVMAGRIQSKECTLRVRVEGNHEMGVYRPAWDTYLLYTWLVKRFDRNVPEYSRWNPQIRVVPSVQPDGNGGYVDCCDYYFTY